MANESDIQFLQYASTIDYPFIGQVVNADLRAFVADITVQLVQVFGDVPDFSIRAGLKIGSFTKSGSSISFTLLFADGTTIVDTASAATTVNQTWGNWKIVEYRNAAWTVKLVVNTDATTDFSVTGDDNTYLSARCLSITPLFVKQIAVNSVLVSQHGVVINPTPTTRTFTSNVKFQAGFNFKIEHEPTAFVAKVTNEVQPAASDLSSMLRFNVIPGAGEGKYSDCITGGATTPYIQTINGRSPDAKGNLSLSSDDCYRVERPVHFTGVPPDANPRQGSTTPGELELNGDCTSCTDCDDYYNTYVMLRRVYQQLKKVRDKSEVLANQYQHVGRLVESYNRYLLKPEVRLRFVNQGSTFTAQLSFRTGNLAFDDFQFKIAWPTFAGTFQAVNFSAWQRLHGEQPKQVMDVIKIGPAVADPGDWLYNFTYTRLFKPHTLHWWSWAFTATPTFPPLTPPTVLDPITDTIDLEWTWKATPNDGGLDPDDYTKVSKRRIVSVYPSPSTIDPEVTP